MPEAKRPDPKRRSPASRPGKSGKSGKAGESARGRPRTGSPARREPRADRDAGQAASPRTRRQPRTRSGKSIADVGRTAVRTAAGFDCAAGGHPRRGGLRADADDRRPGADVLRPADRDEAAGRDARTRLRAADRRPRSSRRRNWLTPFTSRRRPASGSASSSPATFRTRCSCLRARRCRTHRPSKPRPPGRASRGTRRCGTPSPMTPHDVPTTAARPCHPRLRHRAEPVLRRSRWLTGRISTPSRGSWAASPAASSRSPTDAPTESPASSRRHRDCLTEHRFRRCTT